MKTPIIEKLNKLNDLNAISLHVPGHKNMTIGHLEALNISMDKTEITGLDDLHHPEDIILQSMNLVKKHEDYTAHLLVNGTTSGILSVIQAFNKEKGRVLLMRNSHKSVLHALDISNQFGQFTEMIQSSTSLHYQQPLFNNLDKQKNKLAVLTYPNYYGETYDVSEKINELHNKHIPVLVDEAHGAHFGLQGFPQSSLNCRADYVVQSYHKTLPALTMGSMLFIHKDAPLRNEIIKYLNYFQTSSPSYLIMASLESAHQFYNEYDEKIFFIKRNMLIKQLKRMEFKVIQVDDPLKLLIRYQGATGEDIQAWLEAQHIYVELADEYQVLLVLPLWHNNDSYPFNDLLHRIAKIQLPQKKWKLKGNFASPKLLTDSGEYKPFESDKTTWLDFTKANGRIVAQHIVPYPPGIPTIIKGETITENMIELLEDYYKSGLTIEGMENNKILVEDE
ncbi:aminotransferase class V-fold PLP-dependent enzyme [Staphylococcus simiae]|uniref:Orn/Lys/Arg decarboxylase family protein n=1 Tax=Staphylococcus simiae CCM 7213 = CCUG 51256 TaxID=911238 RepID=G5JJ56_9STAP|nr:aminotransferase class V-fold PLP-dependent enzyme [Staphylococcus simiae]EHJ07798.1 Orn/Lys/Arg decarboxylase family protein [Staphylococcus simiae CCM 7213 = CCUG 51256]PNZ10898.1 aminotransferase class V-fold PLP-dependent enzyme [Staphylococcus simiae]SNV61271.1 Arginine decarboxylase / Lysine decarboxylase [Staphylococcus simiae]